MSSLQDALRIYDLAAEAVSPRYMPDRTAVADPAGQHFTHQLAALQRHLGEQRADPIWREVLGFARLLRWCAAVEPVPLQAPVSGAAHVLEELLNGAEALRHSVSDEPARLLDALVASARALREQESNPLAQAVDQALEVSDRASTCIVLVKRRIAQVTAQWLNERWSGLACITPHEYLGDRLWDQAIFVGAVIWFPEPVFTAPRADHVELIVPSWIKDHPHVTGLFGDLADPPLVVSFRERRQGMAGAHNPEIEEQVAAETVPLAPHWSPEHEPSPDAPEAVEAHRILLGGGYAVYLEEGADRIRGLDPTLPAGERVMYLPATAIAPGSILLLRLGDTETAALKAVASELLGAQSTRVYVSQAFWKNRLRAAVLRDGRESVARALQRYGAQATNLSYWIGPGSIRPRSDQDFRAVLRLIGVRTAEPYLEASRALWSAHIQAGQRLTEELERRVAGADLTRLDTEGKIDLHLNMPGVASMTAFRVLAISPHTLRVHPTRLRVPFQAPEARWLE